MLIKHGDGKVLSVVKNEDLEDSDQENIETAAINKLKKADARIGSVKTTKKEDKKSN